MLSTVEIKRTARQAGLLYLASAILAMVGFFSLRPRFVVSEDPTATARNILAGEQLYRGSILINLVGGLFFILAVLALYRLFKDVNRGHARIMVALIGTSIAAQFALSALSVAPLVLLRDASYLSAFNREQLETLSYLCLTLVGRQADLLMWFWGLWLFPFAVLTMRSGFLPRFLGVLLIASGVAYVGSCVTAIMFPSHVDTVGKLAMPLYFGEFIVILWLAFVGARPRPAETHAR